MKKLSIVLILAALVSGCIEEYMFGDLTVVEDRTWFGDCVADNDKGYRQYFIMRSEDSTLITGVYDYKKNDCRDRATYCQKYLDVIDPITGEDCEIVRDLRPTYEDYGPYQIISSLSTGLNTEYVVQIEGHAESFYMTLQGTGDVVPKRTLTVLSEDPLPGDEVDQVYKSRNQLRIEARDL